MRGVQGSLNCGERSLIDAMFLLNLSSLSFDLVLKEVKQTQNQLNFFLPLLDRPIAWRTLGKWKVPQQLPQKQFFDLEDLGFLPGLAGLVGKLRGSWVPFVHQNEVTGINMGNLVCKMVLHHDIMIIWYHIIHVLYASEIDTEHVSKHSISYSRIYNIFAQCFQTWCIRSIRMLARLKPLWIVTGQCNKIKRICSVTGAYFFFGNDSTAEHESHGSANRIHGG